MGHMEAASGAAGKVLLDQGGVCLMIISGVYYTFVSYDFSVFTFYLTRKGF